MIQIDLFEVILENCRNYQLGESIQITGTVDQSYDKTFFSLKRLNVQSIIRKMNKDDSGSSLIWKIFQNLESLRTAIKNQFRQNLSPAVSEVMIALVFSHELGDGQLRRILQQLQSAFILKPAAYTTVLIGELISPMLLSYFPRRLGALVVLMIIFLFEAISGFTLALTRVVITIFLQWLGLITHRQLHSLYLFLISFLLIWVWAPFVILQISFVFTFLCGLGIRLFMPLWGKRQQCYAVEHRVIERLRSTSSLMRLWFSGKKFLQTMLMLFASAQAFMLPFLLHQSTFVSIRNILFQLSSFIFMQLLIIGSLCSFAVLTLFSPFKPVLVIFSGLFHLFLDLLDWWVALPEGKFRITWQWWQVIAWWAGIAGLYWYARSKVSRGRQ